MNAVETILQCETSKYTQFVKKWGACVFASMRSADISYHPKKPSKHVVIKIPAVSWQNSATHRYFYVDNKNAPMNDDSDTIITDRHGN